MREGSVNKLGWKQRRALAWQAIRGVPPVRGVHVSARPGANGRETFVMEWITVMPSRVALLEIDPSLTDPATREAVAVNDNVLTVDR